jgi:hypothetical protein
VIHGANKLSRTLLLPAPALVLRRAGNAIARLRHLRPFLEELLLPFLIRASALASTLASALARRWGLLLHGLRLRLRLNLHLHLLLSLRLLHLGCTCLAVLVFATAPAVPMPL